MTITRTNWYDRKDCSFSSCNCHALITSIIVSIATDGEERSCSVYPVLFAAGHTGKARSYTCANAYTGKKYIHAHVHEPKNVLYISGINILRIVVPCQTNNFNY